MLSRPSKAAHDEGGFHWGVVSSFWSMIKKQIKPAVVMFLLLTILVGIVYPLVVTGIAQVIFPAQANGDLIVHDRNVAGSSLIGQPFSSPDYFWGRLSATSPVPYDAEASGGSNYGPQNPALITEVQGRIDALHAVDPENTQPIPVDLVTSSGSGLDPDISPAAAYYQVPRVARVRNLSENDVSALVAANTANPVLGVFGEPAVNVLNLNLALDDLSAHKISVNPAPVLRSQPANTLFGITINDWAFLVLLGVILALLLVPVGEFMFRVYTGKQTFLSPLIMPVEGWILRMCGAGSDEEMDWKQFAVAMMIFSIIGIAFVFFIQEVQQVLPLNPLSAGPVSWDLSLNTAVSFATNTNWQFYVPETTVSYLTQMVGLAVQNFMSAAVGMAILVAFIYGFSRRSSLTIGNFWVLLVRGIWILLPISFVIALVLVSQGTPQTFGGPVTVPLLNPVNDSNGNLVTTQSISLGPAASQIAIKMLGTNGGGFFNANSAHPYENPTWLSNLIEIIAILLIPVSLCFMFGKMIGSVKKGMAILIAMTLLFVPLLGLGIWSEIGGNPAFTLLGSIRHHPTSSPGVTWRERRYASASSHRQPSRLSPPSPAVVRLIRCTIRSCRWAVLSRYSTSSWVK